MRECPWTEEDVKAIGYPLKRRKAYKISGIDKTRCYIESIKSYPLNIESRHVKTYKASDPPSNSSTGSISMELNNSMVLLPVKPMRRRYFDQRVGWFSRSQTDYGLENQKSKSVRYLDRWKLEVKKEDIEKLKAHTGMIIIVTPDGEKSLTSGETAVLRIPFHEFVKDSKALLGVKLRHTEVQSLSNKLKRKLYWNQ